MTACGVDSDNNTTATTTQEDILDYIEQHTTTTVNPDGSTTVTLITGTENPVVPTQTTSKPIVTKTRPKTTTKSRVTTSTSASGTTVIVTQKPTTTTQKPAPIPTMSTATTTTTVTTANPPAQNTTTSTAPTTTVPSFSYEYTENQQHTPISLNERYYYSLLDEEWKGYYRKIDEAVRYLDASVTFDCDITQDRKHYLYFLYMFDTPELFYLANTTTINSSGNGKTGLTFAYAVGNKEGEYCRYGSSLPEVNDALRQKIRAKQEIFENNVYTITNTIPANAPDVVKERMIYDLILKTSYYNMPAAMGNPDAIGGRWDGLAADNWTAYGIIVNRTGVCESYAEAFQTLCNAVGISCTGIVGTAGGGHKWNAIKLGGKWYMCDITFDDPIGGDPDEAYHHYFNLTGAKMREYNHEWPASNWEDFFSSLPFPVCNGTQYSWENFVMQYGQ